MTKTREFIIDGERYFARNVTDAREQHAEYCTTLVQRSYDAPFVITIPDRTMVAFPWGAGYAYASHSGIGVLSGMTTGYKTRHDAIRAMRCHAAQIAFDPQYLGDNADDRAEFWRWASWHVRYADARAMGADDNAARDFADQRIAA